MRKIFIALIIAVIGAGFGVWLLGDTATPTETNDDAVVVVPNQDDNGSTTVSVPVVPHQFHKNVWLADVVGRCVLTQMQNRLQQPVNGENTIRVIESRLLYVKSK